MEMPGIGRSTAGAILSLARGQRHPILDGNVKRVLARYFAVEGWPGQTSTLNTLWEHAELLTPQTRVDQYSQAMMDLGATLCTRSKPACDRCPLANDCEGLRQGRQADFPGKKPKKTQPVRSTWMLVLRSEQNGVLLEKRPPSGIWGGLLGLPMFDSESDLLTGCENLDPNARIEATWPTFRHTFSHFHLDITPIRVTATDLHKGVMEANEEVWYKGGSLPGGLAAPVSRLLRQVFNEQNVGK